MSFHFLRTPVYVGKIAFLLAFFGWAGEGLANDDTWSFSTDRKDSVATIVPGGRASKALSLTCIRADVKVADYTGRADIRDHSSEELVLYITRSSVGSNGRAVGEPAPIVFTIDGEDDETIDLVRVRPENRLTTNIARSGGLVDKIETAQTFSITGDKRTQDIPVAGFSEALQQLRDYCKPVPEAAPEDPVAQLAPSDAPPVEPSPVAPDDPQQTGPDTEETPKAPADKRAELQSGTPLDPNAAWLFDVRSRKWQGRVMPRAGRRVAAGGAISLVCLRPGITFEDYNNLSGVSILEHQPDEFVLYITRSSVGSTQRAVGEEAPVTFWIDGKEAFTLNLVRNAAQRALTINLPRDSAFFETIAQAETLEISGDTSILELPVEGFAEALDQLRAHCSTPPAPPQSETVAEDVNLVSWYGNIACNGFSRAVAKFDVRETTPDRFAGTLTISHENSLVRGLPQFTLVGGTQGETQRFVVESASGGKPGLQRITPFVFDPSTGEATFDGAGACHNMTLALLDPTAPRFVPTEPPAENGGVFFNASTLSQKCEAVINWLDRVGQEYTGKNDTRIPSTGESAWKQIKLLSDALFVPLFGNAFDQMSEDARREVYDIVGQECYQDLFFRERLRLWRESIGNTIYGSLTDNRRNRMSPAAAVFALHDMREVEHVLKKIDAGVISAQNFDTEFAALRDVRGMVKANPHLLWPSERAAKQARIDNAIASLAAAYAATEVERLRSIDDTFERLRAMNAFQARFDGALGQEMSGADRSALKQNLSSDRSAVVSEVTEPYVSRAQAAGSDLSDVRALRAMTVSADLANVLSLAEQASLKGVFREEAEQRLTAIMAERIAGLDGLTADRAGLASSVSWIEEFRREFSDLADSPSVESAVSEFVSHRVRLLEDARRTFEVELDGAQDGAESAEILSAYLAWPPDQSLPVSLEYRLLEEITEIRLSQNSDGTPEMPWEAANRIAALNKSLLADFSGRGDIGATRTRLLRIAEQEAETLATAGLDRFERRVDNTPRSWGGVDRLASDREDIVNSAYPAAFASYLDMIKTELDVVLVSLEEDALEKISTFAVSRQDLATLYDLGERETKRFSDAGSREGAKAISDAIDARATDILVRDLPVYEAEIAAIAATYQAVEDLGSAAAQFENALGINAAYNIYANAARDRADKMLGALCDAALADAGLTKRLAEQSVLVSGVPTTVRDFVCELDRLGHDVREFASPGSLADQGEVTFRVARREDGPFDFVVLRAVEALPGKIVLVGTKIGDALVREAADLEDWENYTSVLMGTQAAKSSIASDIDTPQGVFNLLSDATVWIVAFTSITDSSYSYSSGTGFFIDPETIVTNAHVADNNGSVFEHAYIANRKIGIRRIKFSASDWILSGAQGVDAAVYKVEDYQHDRYLSFAQDHRVGEWIASAGFPGTATDSDFRAKLTASAMLEGIELKEEHIISPVIVDGRSNNIVLDEGNRTENLQFSMAAAKGASGSAVVNACGEVVALLHEGDFSPVRKNSEGELVAVGSGYTRAIVSSHVEDFLDATNTGYSKALARCAVRR